MSVLCCITLRPLYVPPTTAEFFPLHIFLVVRLSCLDCVSMYCSTHLLSPGHHYFETYILISFIFAQVIQAHKSGVQVMQKSSKHKPSKARVNVRKIFVESKTVAASSQPTSALLRGQYISITSASDIQ